MPIELVEPGSFHREDHFYPRVLNARMHPLVAHFLRMPVPRMVARYCHLHPGVDRKVLEECLAYQPRYFRWSGADLFHVANVDGLRTMILVETNSCPSGQKSTPLLSEEQEEGGYRLMVERTLLPFFRRSGRSLGVAAVLYDKNKMEVSGYAAALADQLEETVYLVPFFEGEENSHLRYHEDYLQVRLTPGSEWQNVRAAFRYVTQKPWTRIPHGGKTAIVNPIVACLAGGRNKATASLAYELMNAELMGSGLVVRTPETFRNVTKSEVPLLMKQMGGFGVVKVPYGNAGQGVYTITTQAELDAFMALDFEYDKFLVQALLGNFEWSSKGRAGHYFHVGTIPNKNNEIYVADLRMMISSTSEGFRPLAVYGRRSRKPLTDRLDSNANSWDMLGTNLSIKEGKNQWGSDTHRLLMMDDRDFNQMGLGVDALLESFIQTVLATIAIDKMAANLVTAKGRFRMKLFRELCDDRELIKEVERAYEGGIKEA